MPYNGIHCTDCRLASSEARRVWAGWRRQAAIMSSWGDAGRPPPGAHNNGTIGASLGPAKATAIIGAQRRAPARAAPRSRAGATAESRDSRPAASGRHWAAVGAVSRR
jgi:hypothetical protein